MKKIMQQAISGGVIALFLLGLIPSAAVCAASFYAEGQERTIDSLTVYRANQRAGQFQKTALPRYCEFNALMYFSAGNAGERIEGKSITFV